MSTRSISPLLRRELANLDDAGSRHSAMKVLKSYVRDLDTKAIPRFLADVSVTNTPASSPAECTISLYEVLARVHGPKIVPQIDNILSTIMRTLSSSAGSFPLHQACSRVVPAIARYAIEVGMPMEEKARIIGSLYKPLCDALMGREDNVSSGAALCLKALVEADNWRFATDDMVNEVCENVAGALEEKGTQTNYHMGLVMALVKHNIMVADAYARSFLRSGLEILGNGMKDSSTNTQKRLSAIQMINALMHCVDSRSIGSELDKVVDAMEKCRGDQFQFVRVAAWEALQTAKAIAGQKESRNGDLMMDRRSDDESTGDNDFLAEYCSPESQTVDSFFTHDNLTESPKSIGQSDESARRTNRRLWGKENGGVDVSLKDGILHGTSSGDESLEADFGPTMNVEELKDVFSGFEQSITSSESRKSTPPSPQRTRTQLSIDNVKIYSTPSKLVRSLQDPSYLKSRNSVRMSPILGEVNRKVAMFESAHSQNYSDAKERRYAENERKINTGSCVHDSEVNLNGSESVSSTSDLTDNSAREVSCIDCEDKNGGAKTSVWSGVWSVMSLKASVGLAIALIFLAVMLSSMTVDNEELYFVPT